jgi:hypothetical protein
MGFHLMEGSDWPFVSGEVLGRLLHLVCVLDVVDRRLAGEVSAVEAAE